VSVIVPSKEKATDFTLPVFPENIFKHSPVVLFQSRAVLSAEPVSTDFPSGEKATE
jgi:hypothetical protein